MINFEESVRLVCLQERVRSATYHEMRKNGHHKSSEGHVSLAFNLPAVIGDDRDPYWSLEVYSYLLCPHGRSETWTGRSAAEVIAQGEVAIGKWCMSAEMEQFGERMGINDRDDGIGDPVPETDADDGMPF